MVVRTIDGKEAIVCAGLEEVPLAGENTLGFPLWNRIDAAGG